MITTKCPFHRKFRVFQVLTPDSQRHTSKYGFNPITSSNHAVEIVGMNVIRAGLVLLSLATSTYAVQRIELDHRIWRLTADFQALQQKMTKAIPADDLR